MVETELVVKIASGGAAQTVRDVAKVQEALAKIGKSAKDTATLAQQLGKAFNLDASEVEELAKALKQVKDLGRGFDSVDTLSQILNSSSRSAEDFADSLGMTTDEALAALAVIDELNNGNVSAADQYALLRDELGLTEEQFNRLSSTAQRSGGRISQVLGGNIQGQVGGLNNKFSFLLKTMLAFGAAAATFKLIDKYLEKTGRTWIDVGAAIGFSRDQLELFAFDWKIGNTAFQKGVEGMKSRAQGFVDTLKNVGAAAKRMGGELLLGGKTGVAGLGELIERLSIGFGAFAVGKQFLKVFRGEVEQTTAKTERFGGVLQGLAAGAAFAVINQLTEAIRGLGRAVVGYISDSLGVAQANRQISIALESVLGSSEQAAKGLQFVRSVVDRTGSDLEKAAQQYTQLSAAAKSSGVEQELVNALFAESSRVFGVFGLGADKANLAFTAITQILSKGTLSMEELRGQLGEQLPIALNAVAEGLGITTAELIDLTSDGEVSGRDFAVAFTKGLRNVEGEIDNQLIAITRLQNGLRDLQGVIGEALRPIQAAFVSLAGNVLEAAQLGGTFQPLIAAAEALQAAFNANPQIIEALANSLRAIATILIGEVAGALQGFANWIEQAPQQAQRAAQSFDRIIVLVSEVAASFGAIALAVGGVAAKSFQDLIPLLEVAANVLGAVAGAIKVLLVDTGGLEIAIKLLIAQFLILKAFALAQVFLGIAGAIGTFVTVTKIATSAMALFGVSVTAAIPPLAALAAAVAAANFIKFVRELKIANDELDAYTTGLNVSTEQGFKFANKLNSLNDAIAEAGGAATEEQQRQLAEYVRLSKDQVAQLEQQLGEVQNFEPKNDAQRQAQQNLIQQLQTTIGALNGQIGEAESTLSATAAGVGLDLAEGGASALSNLVDANKTALDNIAVDTANAKADLLENGGTQAEVAALEKKALEDRIAQNRTYLQELKDAQASGGLSEEEASEVADMIRDVEGQLASDRVSLAQTVVNAQRDAAKAAEDAAKESAKAQADALKETRDEAKRLAEEAFGDTQREEGLIFSEAQAAKAEAFQDGQRDASEAFQKAQQTDQEAFNDQQQSKAKAFQSTQQADQESFADSQAAAAKAFQSTQQADQESFADSQAAAAKAFQKGQQAEAENFQKAQQASAQEFQKQLDAERDQGGREFDVLTSEVERRVQLEQAASDQQRRELEEQFKLEDEQLKKRRDIEAEVLRERGSVLADRQEETQLGPLEQARADFEQQLQDKAEGFQALQQEAAAAFQAEQDAKAEAFAAQQEEADRAFKAEQDAAAEAFAAEQKEADKAFQAEQDAAAEAFAAEQKEADKAFQAEQDAAAKAFQEAQQTAARAFSDEQKALDRAFQAEQQAEERAFKEQQRQLDKANAEAIARILEAAKPRGIDGARRDGGPVRAGGAYLVGEDGPELVTPRRGGYVYTAQQTAALMAGLPTMRGVSVPALGSTARLEGLMGDLLQEVRKGRQVRPQSTYNLTTASPVQDAMALQLAEIRALMDRRGL